MSGRKPHFFKVLLGDFKSRLKIPPKFMKHITNEASRKVVLQDSNGSSWQVELSKTITGNFLSSGWSKFAKDHSLKEHEFLVFKYDGNTHFSVTIFDTTACEREGMNEMKTSKKIAWKEKATNIIKNGRINTEDAELPISKTCWRNVHFSRRTKERSKAEEAANSFHSSLPYTIIRMTISMVYKTFVVRLPLHFSKMHLPRVKTVMVLTDPSGKAWKVNYIPCRVQKKELGYFSGGWAAFARGTNLEEGDFCAFVLTGENEIRVHIFKEVETATSEL